MIKPETLMAMFATCEDSKWVGDVCRSLGGQKVKLDAGQRAMAATITELNKQADAKAAKERERKRAAYAKRKESRR